jgi:hypothetical protein
MWRGEDLTTTTSGENNGESGLRLPWTGNSLGLTDLPFITGEASVQLVALVGPYNSGKTTMLASLYLLLGRGYQVNGFRFAGSRTLLGFELIANGMRWHSTDGPTFLSTQRAPKLEHQAYFTFAIAMRSCG